MKKIIKQHFSLQFVPQLPEAKVNDSVLRKKYDSEPTHMFKVPPNVWQVFITACGGGAAGDFPDIGQMLAGAGGAAGLTVGKAVDVEPGQEIEIRIGSGGRICCHGDQQSLSSLQIDQGAYERCDGQPTLVVDCKTQSLCLMAPGGVGFSGGRCRPQSLRSESGMAALQNEGVGFCNAEHKWIGYGGGGGGGKHGGIGGSVYSNGKTTQAGDAAKYSGCGGGGSALLLSNSSNAKHFVPGSGASGYVSILYEI